MSNLNINDLPQDVQDKLNQITSTNPENLTLDDQAFLKARRGYLRPEQTSIFQGVLDGRVKAIDAQAKVEVKEGEPKAKPSTEDTEDKVKQINPDDYKREVLLQMAKDAGVLPEGEPTKAVLAEAINAHLRGE